MLVNRPPLSPLFTETVCGSPVPPSAPVGVEDDSVTDEAAFDLDNC